MKFAYCDPPYLGQAVKHYGDRHPEAGVYDTITGHSDLIARLTTEFPDGWAMSASSPSLRHLLPLCPEDCRVAAWVKPFASFKPNVNPGYCWEPVIFRGGRPFTRSDPTVRDYVSANITLKKGCPGAKPPEFCGWIFDLLNMQPDDEFVDLFPGSGAVGQAWKQWCLASKGLFL